MKVDILSSNIYLRNQNVHPKIHAKYLDKDIGYRIPKIEVKLLQKYRAYDKCNDESSKKQHYLGTQTWIGLHPQALQTTYNDIYDALIKLKDYNIKRVIDIGAGYGRVGLVMSAIFPDSQFMGFEILKKRQVEGNRIFERYGLKNCEILNVNVLDRDFILPDAQIYFIYDFSELEDLCQILDILSNRIINNDFFLITHGSRIDYLMEKKYKEFTKNSGFLKLGDLKIYSSKNRF